MLQKAWGLSIGEDGTYICLPSLNAKPIKLIKGQRVMRLGAQSPITVLKCWPLLGFICPCPVHQIQQEPRKIQQEPRKKNPAQPMKDGPWLRSAPWYFGGILVLRNNDRDLARIEVNDISPSSLQIPVNRAI